MHCTYIGDVFLVVGDGLSQQLHLGAHGLVRVEAEDVRLQDDVGRVMHHQFLVQLSVVALSR